MNLIWRILFMTLLLIQAQATLAQVDASLDRSQISLGETVQLTLLHKGSLSGDPDLSQLKQDFDILGTNRGTSLQIINGSMSEQTQVQITLAPRHAGSLNIPALPWGNDHSQALVLTVGAQGSATPSQSTDAPSSLFITETLDQSSAYVQSSIILTVHIYTDEPLYQASLELQATPDLLVQTLGKDQQSEETRQGHPYQVITRHYLLIPQRQGNIELPGPILDAQAEDKSHPSSFFGNFPFAASMGTMQPVHLQGKTIECRVLPWPLDATGHALLPTSNLTLQAQWQPSNRHVASGEPLTLHLHLEASGITAASLPDLGSLLNLPPGIRAYPDPAKLENRLEQDHAIGSSDQNIALLATTPGHYKIPALQMTWWDTQHQQIHNTVWPAQSMDFLANSTSAPLTTLSTRPPPTIMAATVRKSPMGLWPVISAALALGWMLNLWFIRRQPKIPPVSGADTTLDTTPSPNPEQAKREHQLFLLANRQDDAMAARQHLLAWGAAAWKDKPPHGLHDMAKRLTDPQHQQWVLQLDRACFTGQPWKGDALADHISLVSHHRSDKQSKPILDELYP